MQDGDALVTDPPARTRRWPIVVAAVVVAVSLALTGILFTRDRLNASAATGSSRNARQDAMALAAVRTVARTLDLDAAVRRSGVVGLRVAALNDFRGMIVGRLGGVVETTPAQWTIGLDGGWACLSWRHGRSVSGLTLATRGVCTDNAPLVATPSVTPARFAAAERRVATKEEAARDAALVAAAIASSSQGYNPRFSLPTLTARFARLTHVPFWSSPTPYGLNVATFTSRACLVPTATNQQVLVTVGRCL
jgi:hypothetical protein